MRCSIYVVIFSLTRQRSTFLWERDHSIHTCLYSYWTKCIVFWSLNSLALYITITTSPNNAYDLWDKWSSARHGLLWKRNFPYIKRSSIIVCTGIWLIFFPLTFVDTAILVYFYMYILYLFQLLVLTSPLMAFISWIEYCHYLAYMGFVNMYVC